MFILILKSLHVLNQKFNAIMLKFNHMLQFFIQQFIMYVVRDPF